MTDIVPITPTSDFVPNPPTRNDTLLIIHTAYQKAVHQATDILEIVRYFYQFLKEAQETVPSADKSFYFKFMAGVDACYQERSRTFNVTSFITYIHTIVLYIVLWMNTNPQCVFDALPEGTFEEDFKFALDVRVISRRKALESDLFKILKKSLKNDHLRRNSGKYAFSSELSANIRDRFGFLCIIQNEDLTIEMEKKLINALSSCIIDIFCCQNLEIKENFMAWLKTVVDKFELLMIEEILSSISFRVSNWKDYVSSPKANGYETLQYTLVVENSPEKYRGLPFECQIRSKRMHKKAVKADGPESHVKHKIDFKGPEFTGVDIDVLTKVIYVDDFNGTSINGFTGYPDVHTYSSDNFVDIFEITDDRDVDGIYLPKVIYQRRVSPSLVNLS